MKHIIVSFYNDVLPPDIAELQRKIFNHFDIEFEQYKFPVGVQHDTAIDNYLTNIIDKTWDFVSIFDVDCIPLNRNVIANALKKIENGNTLYGNVQCTHSLEENTIKSPPYVGPMFCNFSRKVYEEARHKSFGYNVYPNPDGHILEADVGEVFTRENEKRGVNVIYSYPTKINKSGWNKPTIWNYDGSFGYPKFGWGWGTEYDSDTYHNFQIRISEKLFDNISPQELFREYCNSILYGK